ncbi:HD domain-containing phosphohydrolase [Clostridium ganghwense]|uniref:HD domain-containing protein n=1 Tax=Clostridium ganghwense TaxID=312089 RepID=A0ABT4CQ39_9CLOT|nr:HD domain-containing phosphohydrolase [Clostridium ganghwense]MCY6371073.1 HD domain-containing protein [Clostridium ganghwense]
MKEQSNNVKYNICKIEDVTKNKWNEELFKIDEKKYSLIVENQSNLICRFLPDTTLTFVNKAYCDCFNLKYDELIGSKFLKLVPKKDHQKILEKLDSFSVENNSITYEYRVIDSNGEENWQRWTDTAFFDRNDKVIELQSIGTDINKLKRREENLLNNYDKIEKEVKKRTEERKIIEEKLNENIELLKKSFNSSINVVLQIMNIRDPYTVNHQQRVGYLAYNIAKELGLPKEKLNSIYIAGILHDIGKIYVPSEFLSKPGKLNDVEFNIIKSHPQVGYDILNKIKFPWPIDTIVLQHHERINGAGYPYGLMDNEILLEAKIIAVADVVEAMSSHRPYRPALDGKLALEEISNNKGIFYDVDVVEACLRLFNEKQFDFEKEKLDLMDLIELK